MLELNAKRRSLAILALLMAATAAASIFTDCFGASQRKLERVAHQIGRFDDAPRSCPGEPVGFARDGDPILEGPI